MTRAHRIARTCALVAGLAGRTVCAAAETVPPAVPAATPPAPPAATPPTETPTAAPAATQPAAPAATQPATPAATQPAPPTATAPATPATPATPAAKQPATPAAAQPAASPTPTDAPSTLEASVALAPTLVFEDPANPAYTQSYRRVGVYGEVAFAYRSHYFLDPFISVGYATLASGESILPNGPWGAGGTLTQHLGAWVISPGITTDLWRFRLRFALGLGIIEETNSYLGVENASSQVAFAQQLGLGFNVLDTHAFRLDAETRLVMAPGADVTFVTLGVVARGDLICFSGCPR
jgi:hypothetical protein